MKYLKNGKKRNASAGSQGLFDQSDPVYLAIINLRQTDKKTAGKQQKHQILYSNEALRSHYTVRISDIAHAFLGRNNKIKKHSPLNH